LRRQQSLLSAATWALQCFKSSARVVLAQTTGWLPSSGDSSPRNQRVIDRRKTARHRGNTRKRGGDNGRNKSSNTPTTSVRMPPGGTSSTEGDGRKYGDQVRLVLLDFPAGLFHQNRRWRPRLPSDAPMSKGQLEPLMTRSWRLFRNLDQWLKHTAGSSGGPMSSTET